VEATQGGDFPGWGGIVPWRDRMDLAGLLGASSALSVGTDKTGSPRTPSAPSATLLPSLSLAEVSFELSPSTEGPFLAVGSGEKLPEGLLEHREGPAKLDSTLTLLRGILQEKNGRPLGNSNGTIAARCSVASSEP